MDTCCIDKGSSAELSEAINLMYEWYQRSTVCVAYLSNVRTLEEFGSSKWFTRGWTLQELLAPYRVEFYDFSWAQLGSKNKLANQIFLRTSIKIWLLQTRQQDTAKALETATNYRHEVIQQTCVAEKMVWSSGRVTSRVENTAYCLLGLFGVNMPLLYGEGKKAFKRLQLEIIRTSDDETIFACSQSEGDNLLVSSPECYREYGTVRINSEYFLGYGALSFRKPYQITNKGLQIEAQLIPLGYQRRQYQVYAIPLRCCYSKAPPPQYPLLLHVEAQPRDITGMRYVKRSHVRDNPDTASEDEWDRLLQSGGTGDFDFWLQNYPKTEIFIPL